MPYCTANLFLLSWFIYMINEKPLHFHCCIPVTAVFRSYGVAPFLLQQIDVPSFLVNCSTGTLALDSEKSVNVGFLHVTSVSTAVQAMVETVNNLLQPRAQAAWRELPTSEQLHSATLLLDTVETGAFMLADNLLKTDTVQETTDNIREYIFLVPFTVLQTQLDPAESGELSRSLLRCPQARHLTSIWSCGVTQWPSDAGCDCTGCYRRG